MTQLNLGLFYKSEIGLAWLFFDEHIKTFDRLKPPASLKIILPFELRYDACVHGANLWWAALLAFFENILGLFKIFLVKVFFKTELQRETLKINFKVVSTFIRSQF